DPSTDATASFTYEANEPGSSFECALDGAAFASCPSTGISYDGLASGSHAFQVRARDSSGNIDPTPAGYSFMIVLPAMPVVQAPPAPPAAPPLHRSPAPPTTTITQKPAARTHDRTPTFRFHSTPLGASYQCKLDSMPYKACHSPYTTAPLKLGH